MADDWLTWLRERRFCFCDGKKRPSTHAVCVNGYLPSQLRIFIQMTTAPARLSRLAGGAGGRSATRRRPRPTQSSAPKSTSLVASTAATTAAASTGNPNRARMLAMSKSLERKRLASSRVTAALDSVSATGSVSLPVLKAACACFDPSDWDQVMIERNLADACGYPLCPAGKYGPDAACNPAHGARDCFRQ
ncbi:hypothetical protein BC828DRAFT_30966 [Blastocladiella britannica]|nr:hypothetical protein BC828DRAFT_30966 [Blastocladiella britannica]